MTKASSGGRILARMDRTLILGTTNDGKLRELVELLAPFDAWVTLETTRVTPSATENPE